MSRSTEPFIPFSRPTLGGEEEIAVIDVMRSGWLTTGRVTLAFESEFAGAVGTRHALAVSSATAGLHLALEAVGVGPGDRVALSPYTFTASAEVIRYLGADPVFVDIDERSLNIDTDRLRAVCHDNPNVRAIMPVHIGGRSCRMDAIMDVAAEAGKRHGHAVAVVEDAAHAYPGNDGDRMVGTVGSAGVYSFYANKTMTTGEGGMVVTDSDELAARVSTMRLHGIDRPAWDRYTAHHPAWRYDVVEAGFKYNMSDLLAAIGRVQLNKAASMCDRRRAIARRYLDAFAALPFLRLPDPDPNGSWHLFILRLADGHLSINRDQYISELSARGVGTSVHYVPLHIMTYYRDRYGLNPDDYPVSLRCYQSALSLPIYPGLTDNEVERVITAVIEVGRTHAHG